jgi:outer membrane lipoprotein-sorting protein
VNLTRSVRLAVLCLMLLVVTSAFAFQGPQPFSADMATTSANGNLNMTGKAYFSLPKMRIDMNSSGDQKAAGPFGGRMSMIVDGSAKVAYMVMTDQHMYMEFPTDQNSPMTQRMPKIEDLLRGGDPCAGREGATCKKVGTEAISGRMCDKWEMTEKSGKTETLWMDQKLHFPLKVIAGDITTVYSNIKEGSQDASLFKVPDGFRKMDMGGMGGRRPQ